MKQIKLLGVLALTLTLGLASCNKPANNGGDDSQAGAVSECAKHQWGDKETIKAATCTEPGQSQRTCKVCGAKEEPKEIKALGHDMPADSSDAWTVKTAAGCETEGVKVAECARCKQQVEAKIAALGHDLPAEDSEEWTVTTNPSCTEEGVKSAQCGRCHKAVTQPVAALGHNFAKDPDNPDEDLVNWTKKPSCEEGGVGKKQCTRCDYTEDVTADPLGHEWTTVDGQLTPAQGEGYANFYTYKCAHEGCDKVSLGFKANEPTTESKDHLVFEENSRTGEVGARFWGRPIGNALALSSDGTSVNQQNGEVVYCSTETGDFFEYKFDLTAAQAETLSTCRCYCDAQAANYLNGTDFWAYGASNDEWTPGYYIDGGEGHVQLGDDNQPVMVKDHARVTDHAAGTAGEELDTEVPMGKRIEDYRYILYVDGEVCEFDKTITAPTHGSNQNMQREEFVMPYTFHLHEGTNTISLRMAGGYRSVFYNFYFRQYVAPAA